MDNKQQELEDTTLLESTRNGYSHDKESDKNEETKLSQNMNDNGRIQNLSGKWQWQCPIGTCKIMMAEKHRRTLMSKRERHIIHQHTEAEQAWIRKSGNKRTAQHRGKEKKKTRAS